MSANNLPSVKNITAKLTDLIKDGQSFVEKSSRDDRSMLGPDILAKLESQITSIEQIPASQHSVVEISSRDILYPLLISTNIDEPSFLDVWILLDVVHILGNHGSCEPALFFWLIEELLDSQSIDGCRKVFDYLESRRERIVAKDFHKKHLVILRSCNELLRRLSRAEDAVFCGRVFMFLFQSFPLGDKSSVNLRGEFHVENVTTYEEEEKEKEEESKEVSEETTEEVAEDAMDIDKTTVHDASKNTGTEANAQNDEDNQASKDQNLDIDALYPVFWTLQESFANPPRLFDQNNFNTFKAGLQSTVEKFKEVPSILQGANREGKRGSKRRLSGENHSFANNYNPKYLTSKDLFKLELSDPSFQRHILVQALILIDFLLSLTEKAKSRLQAVQAQKALQYNFTLQEEDVKWANAMKAKIAGYLQDGPDGKFYYRMVDTVLTRDKNWVRWKLESCPPISRPPASSEDLAKAIAGIKKTGANKRLRPAPMGSLNLDFLSNPEVVNSLQSLKEFDRYELPSGESILKSINGDELDKEMASTEEERKAIDEAILSKTWKLLRVTSKSSLALFDKINNGKELQNLFQTKEDEPEKKGRDDEAVAGGMEASAAAA